MAKLILLISISLSFLFSIESSYKKNFNFSNRKNNDFSQLKFVDFSKDKLSSIYLKKYDPYPFSYMLSSDLFFQLGSNKNFFSYLILRKLDDAGIFSVKVFIKDLITDKIVWSKKLRSGEGNREKYSLENFWKKNKNKIRLKLKKYNIKLSNTNMFQSIPLKYRGDEFEVRINSEKSNKNYKNTPFVTKYNINLHSKAYGKKIIESGVYKDEYSSVLGLEYLGYFKLSNTRNRVALLIAEVENGWEGPPHRVSYKIIGAHLKVGFKK